MGSKTSCLKSDKKYLDAKIFEMQIDLPTFFDDGGGGWEDQQPKLPRILFLHENNKVE